MSDSTPEEVSRLIRAAGDGDTSAADRLAPLVYDELVRLAEREIARERPDHTLQATALVHEAWVKLCRDPLPPGGRALFFHAAAVSMRRVLIEYARRRSSLKRGEGRDAVTFDEVAVGQDEDVVDLLALSDALEALRAKDETLAKIVELKFFAGLTSQEAAEALGVHESKLTRDWLYARAWLKDRIRHEDA